MPRTLRTRHFGVHHSSSVLALLALHVISRQISQNRHVFTRWAAKSQLRRMDVLSKRPLFCDARLCMFVLTLRSAIQASQRPKCFWQEKFLQTLAAHLKSLYVKSPVWFDSCMVATSIFDTQTLTSEQVCDEHECSVNGKKAVFFSRACTDIADVYATIVQGDFVHRNVLFHIWADSFVNFAFSCQTVSSKTIFFFKPLTSKNMLDTGRTKKRKKSAACIPNHTLLSSESDL